VDGQGGLLQLEGRELGGVIRVTWKVGGGVAKLWLSTPKNLGVARRQVQRGETGRAEANLRIW